MPFVATTIVASGAIERSRRARDRSEHVRRRREQHELRTAARAFQIRVRDHPIMQPRPSQEGRVLVLRVHRGDDLRLARPERDAVIVPREQIGERGPPRPSANNRASHQVAGLARRKRFSSPRRSRPMLVRCVQNTNTVITAHAIAIGDVTPYFTATAIVSVTALVSEASDT